MASANDVPLAVTIALGVVPIVAASIAGAVALTNTIGRRIERLKNLIEIEQKIPKFMNFNQGLERLMIRELKGIERASSPVFRWYRRISTACVAVYLLAYGAMYLPGARDAGLAGPFGWMSITAGVALVIAILVRFTMRKRVLQIDEPSLIREGVMEFLQKDREESRAKLNAKVEEQEQV